MTGINSLFSQFNIPYAPPIYKGNAPAQNNIAPKGQTIRTNKKQFNSKDLLIPVGTTAAGGIGGFTFAQLNKNRNNKNIESQIKEYKTLLLQKFNENSEVKTINDKLQGANELLTTLKNSISSVENLIKNESSTTKITKLKDGLDRTIQAKECQESNLSKLNMSLKTKYESIVEEPLRKFANNLKNKATQLNKTLTKKAVAIGILIGTIIGMVAVFYIKNKEKKINENNNTMF